MCSGGRPRQLPLLRCCREQALSRMCFCVSWRLSQLRVFRVQSMYRLYNARRMSTRLKTLPQNHTLARGEDAVFTNVRGLVDLNGRLRRAPVRPDEPARDSFPFAPDNIRDAGLRRRGSGHPREQKIDQLPKAIDRRPALSRLVARAHQMP